MSEKDQLTIRLDPIHLELIDRLQPFFGNSRGEVIRAIVIDWLHKELGIDGLRSRKAVR